MSCLLSLARNFNAMMSGGRKIGENFHRAVILKNIFLSLNHLERLDEFPYRQD